MRGVLLSFNIISKISIFLSLVTFVYFGNIFTARQVFIVTSYYNALYDSMLHFWPLAITSWTECEIGFKRIENVLLNNANNEKQLTIESNFKKYHGTLGDIDIFNGTYAIFLNKFLNDSNREKCVTLNNCTAFWKTKNSHTKQGIQNIDLQLRSSCAIIGGIGAGKSTLFQVILSELEPSKGQITTNAKFSYAAQEPWYLFVLDCLTNVFVYKIYAIVSAPFSFRLRCFAGTIQQNVLFMEPFDEIRYSKVIHACALEQDLMLFPLGDATIIGEHGFNLSGGQKARLSLARAIYRNADIYLLDDPLAALDTHVSKSVFDRCIKEFLRDKIVVLITHQYQYLREFDKVIVMENGCIAAQGTVDEIRKYVSHLPNLVDENETPVAHTIQPTVIRMFNFFIFNELNNRNTNYTF